MNRVFESLRNTLFWLSDRLKGSPVKNHLDDIEHVLNSSDKCDTESRSEEHLKSLLQHAVSSTKYYRKYSGFTDIYSFSVINKSIIRDKFEEFLSDIFQVTELFPIVTSGSTGTPFKVFHDKGKRLRHSADTIFFSVKAGYKIGHKILYLKIWAKQKMQNPIHHWLQNIVPVDVIKLNDIQIKQIIKEMERVHSNYAILGYSSALELICKFLEKNGYERVNAKVRSVIAISESMNEYTKRTLKKYFCVPALSRYANLENGIIAQQELNGKSRYLINTASYLVEIFRMDSDEPAEEGQLGRIVVTDLFNYAMPMIRYDTGDIGAIMLDDNEPGKRFLSVIEGRKLDLLYDTDGALVSSYIVYKNMWQYTEIIQYQLIQVGQRNYILKINSRDKLKRENQLIKEFKSFLGHNADFQIEYVSEIPLLASGKRRMIVNNYVKL